MIQDMSREEFVRILTTHLSPTSPIQSQEHLFGRSRQLELIEQALCAQGRSIFIYGDRGVGKTSLAHTVAFSHQSVNHNPVLLACAPHTTFSGLMADAVAALGGRKTFNAETTHTAKVGYQGVGVELGRTRKQEVVPQIQAAGWDLNSIVAALLEAGAARKNEDTVVVVDEFDRIQSDEERGHFADFIKQVGDQRLPIRFVFCGVAESLQKLLGAHGSCYRYLDGIELKTLSWEARFAIIDNAAKALHINVEERPPFPHCGHK